MPFYRRGTGGRRGPATCPKTQSYRGPQQPDSSSGGRPEVFLHDQGPCGLPGKARILLCPWTWAGSLPWACSPGKRAVWTLQRSFDEGTSQVGPWLRLHILNAEGLGSIPGQRTRSHASQLRVCMPQTKIPSATTKTWSSQRDK